MQTFSKRKVDGFRDRDSGATFDGYEFERCEITSCLVSNTQQPALRATIKNCRLFRCSVHQNCSIDNAIVEDCMVDGLETRAGPMFVKGAVYKHVVIKGKIGRLVLTLPPREFSGEPSPFEAANAEYYRTVDWALDLTQVEAQELDIADVPGRLIRRDPTTQILVTRERALAADWRSLPLDTSYYRTCIEDLLRFGPDAVVLIAPHRHKMFQGCLQAQKVLRDAGVAEPD